MIQATAMLQPPAVVPEWGHPLLTPDGRTIRVPASALVEDVPLVNQISVDVLRAYRRSGGAWKQVEPVMHRMYRILPLW
jgi:hypothetical protein